MVVIKARLQKIIRRFTVPDGVAINDLKAKLVELFPELQETSPDSLVLYYKDTDNDLVTVSSDEELQTAMQLLPADGDKTLQLLIGIKATKKEEQQTKEDSDEEDELFDLFGQLFAPSFHHQHNSPFTLHSSLFNHTPFTSLFPFEQPSWSDQRRMFQEQEKCLRQRREYEEKKKIRRAHREHLREMIEKAKKAEEEKRNKTKNEVNEGKVAETTKPSVLKFPPGWVVTSYGSWEPMVHRYPGGAACSVWGPWGYSAHYGEDKDMKGEADQKGEQPENKEETKQEETTTPEED